VSEARAASTHECGFGEPGISVDSFEKELQIGAEIGEDDLVLLVECSNSDTVGCATV